MHPHDDSPRHGRQRGDADAPRGTASGPAPAKHADEPATGTTRQQANPGTRTGGVPGQRSGRSQPNPGIRNADGSREQADIDDDRTAGADEGMQGRARGAGNDVERESNGGRRIP